MPIDAQQLAAIVGVTAAVLYLVFRVWRALAGRGSGRCSGCAACPAAAASCRRGDPGAAEGRLDDPCPAGERRCAVRD
jgi:hypothetical protein